jgi:glycosyltransferase involved in cell wall biosynthesis
MTILIGHPTGNPNAHHAALAHFETGRLAAFCVAWMPGALTLQALERLPGLRPWTQRLARRRFAPLADAPLVQGRWREIRRLHGRYVRGDDECVDQERVDQERNDWLMRTMRRHAGAKAVTAVHGYEDCALWPFEEARRRGRACIYDMPIGYYPAWRERQAALVRDYAEWLPAGVDISGGDVRIARKQREMELADLVLVPSVFTEETIRRFMPNKTIALAPYGVDLNFWTPPPPPPAEPTGKLRFVFAGQISIRKGIPDLIKAWTQAALPDAELELVGPWQMSAAALAALPPGIVHRPATDAIHLRQHYQAADVFVLPSYFEGLPLALLEAMACGLPALVSDVCARPDIVNEACGRVVAAGDLDALVEGLRWFGARRDSLAAMAGEARQQAELFSWVRYRRLVTQAVLPYV